MKIGLKIASIRTALLVASIPTLFAGPMTLNTGTANWRVAYENQPEGPTFVLTTNAPTWAQIQGASWIGSTAADGNYTPGVAPIGNYVFTLNIGQIYGAAGALNFDYAGDNRVTWSITDGWIGGGTSCSDDSCFTTTRTVVGQFSATSVLTARVVNNPPGLNPTGLIVGGQASDVPEPGSTLAMAGCGFAALAVYRRRLGR